MINIRKAEKQDLEELASVHLQCWQESYPGIIPDEILKGLKHEGYVESWTPAFEHNSKISVFVASDNEKIVGLAASGKQRDESLLPQYPGEFYAVYVLKDSQRNKVGGRLMNVMCDDLISRELTAATLWVLEDNVKARKFYQKISGLEGATKEIAFQGISKTEIFYFWEDLKALQSMLESMGR